MPACLSICVHLSISFSKPSTRREGATAHFPTSPFTPHSHSANVHVTYSVTMLCSKLVTHCHWDNQCICTKNLIMFKNISLCSLLTFKSLLFLSLAFPSCFHYFCKYHHALTKCAKGSFHVFMELNC